MENAFANATLTVSFKKFVKWKISELSQGGERKREEKKERKKRETNTSRLIKTVSLIDVQLGIQ